MKSRAARGLAVAMLAALGGGCLDRGASASPVEALGRGLKLDAEGLPIIRAGLWEVSSSEDDGPVKTVRQCLTRLFDGSVDRVLATAAPEGCRKDRTVEARRLKVVSVCDLGFGRRMESDFVLEGSQTEYALTAGVAVHQDGHPPVVSEGRGRGRWLGDCPGDMVPGDVLEFDG